MVFFFFYCLGLPPLPQAHLSDRPTHPCSKEKCTYTCTSRDTHSQREASAHTWTRMFTDECQHSKKKKTKQTHINKYIKMKRCSGIHFPEQLFLFHWDYSTEKPNKAWNNLTREEPDSTQTHTALYQLSVVSAPLLILETLQGRRVSCVLFSYLISPI